MNQPNTRNQQWAERAFERVQSRAKDRKEYAAFAKRFPSLIHTCGLAQALACATTKAPDGFINDVERVLDESDLPRRSRKAQVTEYLRLSRDALAAAGWIKRYAEAMIDDDNSEGG